MTNDFKIIKLENYITLMNSYNKTDNYYAPDLPLEDEMPLN